VSRCRRCSRSSTCFWMVTSSALVGSSSTSRRGPTISARAIANALTLPPGELVRITREQRRELGLRQPHVLQRRQHACAVAAPQTARGVHPQALAHDFLDRHARRQRRKRILEHHLHPLAQGLVGRSTLAPGPAVDLQRSLERQQPSAASASVDLPEPDSPITPSVWPGGNVEIWRPAQRQIPLAKPAPHAGRRVGVRHAQRLRLHHGLRAAGVNAPGRHIAHRLAVDQPAGVGVLRGGQTPAPPDPARRCTRSPSPPRGRRSGAPGSGRA
jgi:hypothetical protein